MPRQSHRLRLGWPNGLLALSAALALTVCGAPTRALGQAAPGPSVLLAQEAAAAPIEAAQPAATIDMATSATTTPAPSPTPQLTPTPEPTPTPAPTPEPTPLSNPQVRIEARVIEWQHSSGLDYDFAVRYQKTAGAPSVLNSADLTLPADPSLGSATRLFFDNMDVGGGSIDAMVETLEQVGKVRVLSQPSIVLTSRQTPGAELNAAAIDTAWDAKLSNAVKIPYEMAQAVGVRMTSITEYRDSGVTLDVSVLSVDADLITLSLNTTVRDLSGFVNVGLNERGDPMRVPTIDSRSIQNRLVIPDRTVFITGLIKTSRQTQRRRGIPWLSELPILETVLANRRDRKEDSELVFLIKPEVVMPYRQIELAADTLPLGH